MSYNHTVNTLERLEDTLNSRLKSNIQYISEGEIDNYNEYDRIVGEIRGLRYINQFISSYKEQAEKYL